MGIVPGKVACSNEEYGFYQAAYFPSLDGLRALSIVPVVWHHSTPYPFPGVLGRGPIGVDLFFAISGFLITTLLLREREQHSRIDLRAFYARRALRIFPLYYFVLGLNVVFATVVMPDLDASRNFLARLPSFATYTANWFAGMGIIGPQLFAYAWSLSTEEQFYAFWAPLLRFTKRVSNAVGIMLFVVFLDLWLEANPKLPVSSSVVMLRTIVTSFASPIGFGALFAYAAHHPVLGRPLVRAVSHGFVSPLVFALTVSLVVVVWAPLAVLHAMLALLVFVCAAQQRHGLSRLLDHRAMAYLGRVSYGIYLLHVAVLGGLKQLFPSLRHEPVLLFVLGMPLSVLVAAISYEYFEKPFLRLASRYRRSSVRQESATIVGVCAPTEATDGNVG